MNTTVRNILLLGGLSLGVDHHALCILLCEATRAARTSSRRRELRNHEYTIRGYAYRFLLCGSTLITLRKRRQVLREKFVEERNAFPFDSPTRRPGAFPRYPASAKDQGNIFEKSFIPVTLYSSGAAERFISLNPE